MKIVIYGLSLTSSWGNGHATTYRALVKALARRGHRVHFVEKDVEWYRSHRDLPDPDYCKVELYSEWQQSADQVLGLAADADAVIVGSYFPDAIEAARSLVDRGYGPLYFYDIDTPITLAELRLHGRAAYLDAQMIPNYAAYLSFTGGPALSELERYFHSPRAVPFYCSVDPDIYLPTPADELYSCDLSYLGTYAQDRQAKLAHLLVGPAEALPERRFLVAGPQYPMDLSWPSNVRHLSHVAPAQHPAFYSSSRFTLNLTRADMVAAGYSPSVRIFEAAACGAAIVSDSWMGIEEFLSPGEEILLPRDGDEVVDILAGISDEQRIRIGRRARERILAQHTAAHRAEQFEQIVSRSAEAVRG